MELREIVIGTGSKDKYREFLDLLSPFGIKLHFGKDMADLEVQETGSTFMENAVLKASSWALATGLPALADDSGLQVEALGGRPGIYSARVGKDSQARRQWLLKELDGKTDRKARFVTALVLFGPEGLIWSDEEYCFGTISFEARGSFGFGYDPLFLPDGYDKTFGELGQAVKGAISHRAKASKAFLKWLANRKSVVE